MSMLAVQFLYRYWSVFDTNKLKYFLGWKLFLWFQYSIFIGAIWITGLLLVITPNEETMVYFQEEVLFRYNKNITELPALIMIPYHPSDESIKWSAWGLTSIQSIISSIQYGIMVFCGWSMYTKMEQTIKTMSKHTKVLHQQLFKVLVIQVTAPTIFLMIPLSFIIYLPFFNLKLSIPTGPLLCSFTIYNAVDSIIIMTVVSEYKAASKKLLLAFLQKFLVWLMKDSEEAGPKTTAVGDHRNTS